MPIKKVAFDFNPFKETGISVPKDKKEEALSAVQDFVKEQVLSYIGEGKSPVAGGHWKKNLSKEYAKRKQNESSVKFSNLELHGDLLNALEVIEVNGSRLSLEVSGDEAPKADGNNRGTYGKEQPNEANSREFIPKEGQTLRKEIWKGIEDILLDYAEEEQT